MDIFTIGIHFDEELKLETSLFECFTGDNLFTLLALQLIRHFCFTSPPTKHTFFLQLNPHLSFAFKVKPFTKFVPAPR